MRALTAGDDALVDAAHYAEARADAGSTRALVSVVAAPRESGVFLPRRRRGARAALDPAGRRPARADGGPGDRVRRAARAPRRGRDRAPARRHRRGRARALERAPGGGRARAAAAAHAPRARGDEGRARCVDQGGLGRRDRRRLDAYRAIRRLLELPVGGPIPDWEEIASRWLELVRPVWYEQLQVARRRRPLLLRDIRAEVIAREEPLGDAVIERFGEASLPVQAPPSERVVACIVGQVAAAE
ncbi:MAG: hypothetical protein U5K43_10035 [Halofilum sp. (in: g-proteobacteria)]|nr:hypothetical protein [Halofilum sp. (in: g-proteobacteria)]